MKLPSKEDVYIAVLMIFMVAAMIYMGITWASKTSYCLKTTGQLDCTIIAPPPTGAYR